MNNEAKLTIKFKNGNIVAYRTSDIECINFTEDLEEEAPLVPYDSAVDLGLSVLWSSFFVGAETPDQIGKFYTWGGSVRYDNYQFVKEEIDYPVERVISNTQYDTAKNEWHGKWRMPTADEIDELINKCVFEEVKYKGQFAMKVTGPNGNVIYLVRNNVLCDYGSHYVYGFWSGELDPNIKTSARYGQILKTHYSTKPDPKEPDLSAFATKQKYFAMSVRAVIDK